MSWFNEVTGTSDYERQSWRDSYNGGRAAGDVTGNVNARLDAERSAFQGATVSGSSTRYGALELAQSMAGVGHSAGASGTGAPRSSGPGNETVTQGPVRPGRPAGGSGAGSRLVIFGDEKALIPKDQQLKRIGNGGQQESFGAISELGWANSGTGYFPVPSSDIKDRIEDGPLEWQWFAKNVAAPALGLGVPSRPGFLDPEYSEYDYFWNEWRVGKQGDRVTTYPGGWTSPGNGYRTGGGF